MNKYFLHITVMCLTLMGSIVYGQQPANLPGMKQLKDYTLQELIQKRTEASAAKATADVTVYDAAIQFRKDIDAALKSEDYDKAALLKEKLSALKLGAQTSGKEKELTDAINKAVAAEDFEKAEKLKKELDALKNGTSTPVVKDTVKPNEVKATPSVQARPVLPPTPAKVIVADTFQYKRFGWIAGIGFGVYSLYDPTNYYSDDQQKILAVCPTLELGVRYRKKKIAYGLILRAGTSLMNSYNEDLSIYDASNLPNPPNDFYTISYTQQSRLTSLYGLRIELASPLYAKQAVKFHYGIGLGVERQNIKTELTDGTIQFTYAPSEAMGDLAFDFQSTTGLIDLSFGPAFRLGANQLSPHLVVGLGPSIYVGSSTDTGMYTGAAFKVSVSIRK